MYCRDFKHEDEFLLLCNSQKRLAREARTQEIQAKNAALGKKIKEPTPAKGNKGRGEASFYRVACKVKLLFVEHILQCYMMYHFFFFFLGYSLQAILSNFQTGSADVGPEFRIMEEECHMMISQTCLEEV